MKKEIIEAGGTTIIKLTPSDGFAYITNGNVITDSAFLGVADTEDNWHDTNDEPPVPEEATVEDYEEQLERFGVE